MLEERELIHYKFKFQGADDEMVKIELVQVLEDLSTLAQVSEILKNEIKRRYAAQKDKENIKCS